MSDNHSIYEKILKARYEHSVLNPPARCATITNLDTNGLNLDCADDKVYLLSPDFKGTFPVEPGSLPPVVQAGIDAVKETEVSKAVNVLRKALREDEGFRYGYQSNIAMAFLDEFNEFEKYEGGDTGFGRSNIHKIANKAAIRFLDLFIGKE